MKEALKLALEALEESKTNNDSMEFHDRKNKAITAIKEALAQPEQEPAYASTQATNCAGCGEHKHTPLRIDAMGGYVCLTCIDKKLGTLLGEFGYPEPEQEPVEITITGKLGNIYSFTGDYSLKKGDKVYTTPPQRTYPQAERAAWVGLTDEEIEQIKLLTFEKEINTNGEEQEAVNLDQLIRAAEQLCKEKNYE